VSKLYGKRILCAFYDGTIMELDATTGVCLNIYNKKDNPLIYGYQLYPLKKLKTENNIIYMHRILGIGKIRKLINVSGLFIHGCSFENLEKGSQWTEEGLKILKMYRGKI